ncbi:MAG: hypothetical protein GX952_00405 [Firmicutes bacterium]|nr:hypothetical protein [Bacillota bacterium]
MRQRWLIVGLIILTLVGIYSTAQGASLTKTLTAVYRNIAIIIDGKANIPSEEPFIVGGHVYVPLRYIAEALKAQVGWDDANSRVIITTPGTSDSNLEQVRQKAYLEGYEAGQLVGSKTSYEKAYNEGYDSGFKKGEKEGYDEGYKDGQRGRDSSRSDYRDGEEDGYDVGYDDGEYAGRRATRSKIDLDWKEALEEYADIRYSNRYLEDDIIEKYGGRRYSLDTRRNPEYTDGFIDGYLDGFRVAFDKYYDY